jgi:rhamnosyltransferase
MDGKGPERGEELVSDPAVSIVMLVLNGAPHLRRSLPIVLAQRIDVPFDVLVVDSGSSDGSLELVRSVAARDARVRVHEIRPHEFHHARTRNMAAERVSGRYVVFLGGDAVPLRDDWLATLLAPVRSGENGVRASYGRQVPRPTTNAVNVARMRFNYSADSRLQPLTEGRSQRLSYFFSSVNCCIDRSVGEPFFGIVPVNEDVTLSKRLIDSGWRVAYVAEAVVEHAHNHTLAEIFQRSFDNGVVYKRLGILGARRDGVGGDGASYVRSGLLGIRGPKDKLLFLGFVAASAAGLTLGLHYTLLPAWARSAFSKFGVAS